MPLLPPLWVPLAASVAPDGAHLAPVREVLPIASVVAVGLTLGLLHLLLYAFDRRQRVNLDFAVLAGAFAAIAILDLRDYAGLPELELPAFGEVQKWAAAAFVVAAARFVYSLFLPRMPRRLWLYAGALVAVLLLGSARPEALVVPARLIALVVIADNLLVVVRNWRRLPEGGWVLGAGMGVFGVSGLVEMLSDLGAVPPPFGLRDPYLFGVGCLLLAASVFLARRFAATSRELERRLHEVEELSRQQLAHERAIRDEEVRRRLVEADNRRKTAELDDARALQRAMLPAQPPEVPGMEVAATVQTATEVGGDLWDHQVDGAGNLTLLLADVVGHGARAGVLVAAMKALWQRRRERGDLDVELRRLDDGLRGLGLARALVGVTLARVGVGGLEVATAGMPPALVRRGDTGAVEEVGPPRAAAGHGDRRHLPHGDHRVPRRRPVAALLRRPAGGGGRRR